MKVIFIIISVIFTLLLRIIMTSLHWKSISNFFIYIREFKIVLFCFVMLCYDFADVYRLFSKPAEISCNFFIIVKCLSLVFLLCLHVYYFLFFYNFYFCTTMLSIQTDSLLMFLKTSDLDTAHYCKLYIRLFCYASLLFSNSKWKRCLIT